MAAATAPTFPCVNPGFDREYVRPRHLVTGRIAVSPGTSSWTERGMARGEIVTRSAQREIRFNRIFSEYYEPISRYCHRRLPDDDANDAAAEVFVVVWKKLEQVPPGDGALPWLYGIARNEVSVSRRSRRRRTALGAKLRGQATQTEPAPESVVLRSEEQEALVDALGSLRDDDQEVLRLRAYEHLTLEEVAVVLGCSLSAAKQRSARAVKRLRRAANLPAPVSDSRATRKGGDG